MKNCSAWEKLKIVRQPTRPNAIDYFKNIFSDFIELKGDRLYGEDEAILSGIATFNDLPVTIIATVKGKNLEENKKHNFASAHPEGYRKALRLAKQAEKFKRPVICFIDTPGAACDVEAEERGQGNAIAVNLLEFMKLKTPIISIVTGEGGSGGALGLGVCDVLAMLENAYYSVISPRGAATILWRDPSKENIAANTMKITAQDLFNFNIVDHIIPEPINGAHTNPTFVYENIIDFLFKSLKNICQKSIAILLEERYNKFRKIGVFNELKI